MGTDRAGVGEHLGRFKPAPAHFLRKRKNPRRKSLLQSVDAERRAKLYTRAHTPKKSTATPNQNATVAVNVLTSVQWTFNE
jgi:hypothetical protein